MADTAEKNKLMRRFVSTILAATLLLASVTVWGDGFGKAADCPKTLEKEALDVASTLRGWGALHTAYMRFGACDDGAVAEGFTESVVRILADKWTTVKNLGRFVKMDPSFLRFVYNHIDATADPKDIQRIRNNLKRPGCPKGNRRVCREIELAVTRTLEEI